MKTPAIPTLPQPADPRVCARCQGNIVSSYEERRCIQCGYRPPDTNGHTPAPRTMYPLRERWIDHYKKIGEEEERTRAARRNPPSPNMTALSRLRNRRALEPGDYERVARFLEANPDVTTSMLAEYLGRQPESFRRSLRAARKRIDNRADSRSAELAEDALSFLNLQFTMAGRRLRGFMAAIVYEALAEHPVITMGRAADILAVNHSALRSALAPIIEDRGPLPQTKNRGRKLAQ